MQGWTGIPWITLNQTTSEMVVPASELFMNWSILARYQKTFWRELQAILQASARGKAAHKYDLMLLPFVFVTLTLVSLRTVTLLAILWD